MKKKPAEIVREYQLPGVRDVHGVTFDGENIWFAHGAQVTALDPASGALTRSLPVPAHAGTAFDGKHLFQIAEDRILKIDPESGRVLSSIPAPAGGEDSGLTWAEGKLWVGHYRGRKIQQIDPETGEVLRVLSSDRYVTGVTWADGELWYGTLENGASDLRCVDPKTGAMRETLEMPQGARVSGMESDGKELIYCGGGMGSDLIRAVKRTRRESTSKK